MNKRIYLLLSVGFIMIALLGAVCLYQGIRIKELAIQSSDQRIMLDQIYFEVYGTQFTEDYKPSENDSFFPMFNSRIDEAKNLGLKVQAMNKNIEILCSHLLKQYQSVSGNQADLEIEIAVENPYQELIMNRAYLECLHSSFSYKTRYRVFKDKKVELEELGWSKN